jgi:hypothetical protein
MGSKALFIAVPMRLNAHQYFDVSVYQEAILRLFRLPQFRGFVGGDCWGESYFFPAASRSYLYIMDPSTTQKALDTSNLDIPSQPRIVAMRWPRLDSSMVFGFYVESMEDLERLKSELIKNSILPFVFKN